MHPVVTALIGSDFGHNLIGQKFDQTAIEFWSKFSQISTTNNHGVDSRKSIKFRPRFDRNQSLIGSRSKFDHFPAMSSSGASTQEAVFGVGKVSRKNHTQTRMEDNISVYTVGDYTYAVHHTSRLNTINRPISSNRYNFRSNTRARAFRPMPKHHYTKEW